MELSAENMGFLCGFFRWSAFEAGLLLSYRALIEGRRDGGEEQGANGAKSMWIEVEMWKGGYYLYPRGVYWELVTESESSRWESAAYEDQIRRRPSR
jgi:hypothetical protein